ncbi:MAG: LCP family protein [Oscillospiraceae bacterium]|nr:LCP family protein [Oscillospiraceae bacterium]
MRKPNSYDPQEFDRLSQRIDDLMEPNKAPAADDGIDLAQYTPADISDVEDTVYQNFSNGYGAQPRKQEPRWKSQSHNEYRDYGGKPQPTQAARKAAAPCRKSSRRGCGCGCATVLLLLTALAVGALLLIGSMLKMPVSDQSIGPRKDNTATVLLCGTDKDGTRTDTMMLVYLDGNENRVGLLSLPRDTLTITDSGKKAKLNSAYGRNGCGEEGMEWTLNYVQDIIGYRPDGYILVDMELVPKIVDLMGGVNVHLDHHIRVETDGVEVYVPKGDQHLDGEEVLATLRYRYGYANADLGRVQVQRMVITECMKQ